MIGEGIVFIELKPRKTKKDTAYVFLTENSKIGKWELEITDVYDFVLNEDSEESGYEDNDTEYVYVEEDIEEDNNYIDDDTEYVYIEEETVEEQDIDHSDFSSDTAAGMMMPFNPADNTNVNDVISFNIIDTQAREYDYERRETIDVLAYKKDSRWLYVAEDRMWNDYRNDYSKVVEYKLPLGRISVYEYLKYFQFMDIPRNTKVSIEEVGYYKCTLDNDGSIKGMDFYSGGSYYALKVYFRGDSVDYFKLGGSKVDFIDHRPGQACDEYIAVIFLNNVNQFLEQSIMSFSSILIEVRMGSGFGFQFSG